MKKVLVILLMCTVFSYFIKSNIGNNSYESIKHESKLSSNHENEKVDDSTFEEVDNWEQSTATIDVAEELQPPAEIEDITESYTSPSTNATARIPNFKFRELFSSDISERLLTMQDKVGNGNHQVNTSILSYINKLQTEMLSGAGSIYSEESRKLLQSEQWDALYHANIFHAIQGCRTQSTELCYVNIAHISLGIELSNPEDFYSWKVASRNIAGFWVGFPAEDWHLKESYPRDYIPDNQIELAMDRANVIKDAMEAEEWDFKDFSQAFWGYD